MTAVKTNAIYYQQAVSRVKRSGRTTAPLEISDGWRVIIDPFAFRARLRRMDAACIIAIFAELIVRAKVEEVEMLTAYFYAKMYEDMRQPKLMYHEKEFLMLQAKLMYFFEHCHYKVFKHKAMVLVDLALALQGESLLMQEYGMSLECAKAIVYLTRMVMLGKEGCDILGDIVK